MPKKETKVSRSRGSVKSSVASQKCTQNSKNTLKISKFFTKETRTNSDEGGSSDFSDSPYKNCLNSVKSANLNNSDSDLNDFKTPKAIKKVSKVSQKPKETSRKRKKTVQVPLRNFLEENFKHVDVNPDHLQMALALSESSYEAEHPSSQEKNESFKKAFEKFGFGYKKNRAPVELKREPSKTKKSRYKYVTPILKIRTQEEREALISSKVSLILAQNKRNMISNCSKEAEPQVSSRFLRKYVGELRIIQLHRFELTELNKEGVFYVPGLGIEVSPASCGCLLKDWRRIPGREPTPERGDTPAATPSENVLEKKTKKDISEGGRNFISENRENELFVGESFHNTTCLENGGRESLVNISPSLKTSHNEEFKISPTLLKISKDFIGETVEDESTTASGSCDRVTSPCLELSDDEDHIQSLRVNKDSKLKISPRLVKISPEDFIEEKIKRGSTTASGSCDRITFPCLELSDDEDHIQFSVNKSSTSKISSRLVEISFRDFIGEKVEGKSTTASRSCDGITPPYLEISDDEDHIQSLCPNKNSTISARLEKSFGEVKTPSSPNGGSFYKISSPKGSPHKINSPAGRFHETSPNGSFCKITSASRSFCDRTSPSGSFDKIISPDESVQEVSCVKSSLTRKPSKYELSPPGSPLGKYLDTSKDDTIIITPYKNNNGSCLVQIASNSEVSFTLTPPKNNRVCSPNTAKTPSPIKASLEVSSPRKSNKRSFECLSPDLFDDEDNQSSCKNSPIFVKSPIFNHSKLASSSTAEEMECYDLTQSEEEEKSFHLNLSLQEISTDQRSDLNVTDYVNNILTGQEPPSGSKLEKISTSEDDSQQSQSSIYISDDELNYSSVFGTPHPRKEEEENRQYEDDRITSPVVELLSLEERIRGKCANKTSQNVLDDSSNGARDEGDEKENLQYDDNRISPVMEGLGAKTHNSHQLEGENNVNKASHHLLNDSLNDVFEQISSIETPNRPGNNGFIIKTSNITPMANYEEMDTPKIVKELDKFGLKPLKRQKGAKLLRYIYESTHPVVQDENGKVLKKRRTKLEYPQDGVVIIGDVGENEEDLIFERTQSKKISSCRVPLHIVWYNLVMSNPKIRENILLYEPLQLEILHSMIKEQGYKFNIQDLLQFLDKKCITIRTAQGQHHSGKKQKRF